MKTNLAKIIDLDDALHQEKSPQNKQYSVSRTSLSERAKEILENDLDYWDDDIIQKPLIPWVNELIHSLHYPMQGNEEKLAATVADIYNQAVKIFIFLDDIKSAREICYTQIQLFIRWSDRSRCHDFLKNIFQPWINLSQIDRREGLFSEAKEKITRLMNDELNSIDNHQIMFNKLLHRLPCMSNDLNYFVTKARVTELIKLYLAQKDYVGLIDFIENRTTIEINSCKLILQEALLIALANTGQMTEALRLSNYGESCAETGYIFSLRKCEMNAAWNQHKDGLFSFYHQASDLLNKAPLNLNKIRVVLRAINLMKKTGLMDYAIKLAYFCLAASCQINDDSLKAESLLLLYDMIVDAQGRQIIEDLIMEHALNTKYSRIRTKLFNALNKPDDEGKPCDNGLVSSLFEELLMFADRIVAA